MSREAVSGTSWSPFAVSRGEPGAFARNGLAAIDGLPAARSVCIVVAITWLPLAVLTGFNGTAVAGAVAIPFFSDHIPHGRFLIAAPLLLASYGIIERRTARALKRLRGAGLIRSEDEPVLHDLIEAAARAWRSRWAHAIVLALPCLAAITSYFWWREQEVSHWMLTGSRPGVVSAAGIWNLFVAAPLLHVLFLLAGWRFALWVWVLIRLARLKLRIDPFHPDQRCGLLFLGSVQLAFLPLVAAFGVQLGCVIAVLVRHQGAFLSSFQLLGAAFVLLSLALILGPLGVFAHRAWLAIEDAEDAFGTWSTLTAERMSVSLSETQREYIARQLGTSEISSMADAAWLFERVLTTSSVPVDLRQILAVAATAMGSTLFPLLALLPITDIVERLAKILL